MMVFFKNRLNRGVVHIASANFLIGTLLFLGYLAFPEEPMLVAGVTFVVLFIAVQIVLLATLFLNSLIHFKDYEENMTAFILSFLNVPLAFLYLNLI